ncbi:hypothetical protein ABK040_015629 [Willaertia magna]
MQVNKERRASSIDSTGNKNQQQPSSNNNNNNNVNNNNKINNNNNPTITTTTINKKKPLPSLQTNHPEQSLIPNTKHHNNNNQQQQQHNNNEINKTINKIKLPKRKVPSVILAQQYNEKSQKYQSYGNFNKAYHYNKKAISQLEFTKNQTCDNNALNSINILLEHYNNQMEFQKTMLSKNKLNNQEFNNNNNQQQLLNNLLENNQIFTGQQNYWLINNNNGSSPIAHSSIFSEINNSSFNIGDSTNSTILNNNQQQQQPTISLRNELYQLFIRPWEGFYEILDRETDNEALKRLYYKNLLNTQQGLTQLMRLTLLQEEEESMMHSSSRINESNNLINTPTINKQMTPDLLSKKLLSLSHSLNTDKVNRLQQQVNVYEKEIQQLRLKIKQQQKVINEHENNWHMIKKAATNLPPKQ